MAAQEQQQERVVLLGIADVVGRRDHERVGGRADGRRVLTTATRPVAAQQVGQAAGRDADEPAARALRKPAFRPLHRCGQERFLDRVLARVEVPVAAHQRAEDLRRELAQQVLDAGTSTHISDPPSWRIGRISTSRNAA